MESAPPHHRPRKTPVGLIIAGVVIVALVLLMVGFGPNGLFLDGDDQRTPAADVAMTALQQKVSPGPISDNEQSALEAALNDRFPQGSRVISHTAFYFDGAATSCGFIRPKGSGPILRYIYRNDFVMAEGDASPADFAMFWQICQAGGAG